MRLECPHCGFDGVETRPAGPYVQGFYAKVKPHRTVKFTEINWWDFDPNQPMPETMEIILCPGSDGPPRVTP